MAFVKPCPPSPSIFHYFDAGAIRPRPPRKKIAVHRVIVAQKAKLTILRRRSSFFFLFFFFFTKRRIKLGSKGSIKRRFVCKTSGRRFQRDFFRSRGNVFHFRPCFAIVQKIIRHELLPVGTKIIGRIYCRNLFTLTPFNKPSLVTPITTKATRYHVSSSPSSSSLFIQSYRDNEIGARYYCFNVEIFPKDIIYLCHQDPLERNEAKTEQKPFETETGLPTRVYNLCMERVIHRWWICIAGPRKITLK